MLKYGCAAVAVGAFGLAAYVMVTVPSARIGVLGVALVILLNRLWVRWQLRQAVTSFRRTHGPSGRDVLIVYSASPHWQDYIDSHWLTRWTDRALVLNRSAPDWQDRPEAELWRRLAGRIEHTPVAIVVPQRGRPQIVRFYSAFKDYKHGKPATLHARERDLERVLSASAAASQVN